MDFDWLLLLSSRNARRYFSFCWCSIGCTGRMCSLLRSSSAQSIREHFENSTEPISRKSMHIRKTQSCRCYPRTVRNLLRGSYLLFCYVQLFAISKIMDVRLTVPTKLGIPRLRPAPANHISKHWCQNQHSLCRLNILSVRKGKAVLAAYTVVNSVMLQLD